jgi:hypothetical protein
VFCFLQDELNEFLSEDIHQAVESVDVQTMLIA